jgi:L-glyceraldehyde 3-phosphate reductase
MALSWLLRDEKITSVLVGVSSIEQLKSNIRAQDNIAFSEDENNAIEELLK